MVSRVPESSPEATRLQNRSSNRRGYLARDGARPLPEATSLRILITSSFILGLSAPSATMSKLCTSGTPALSMVASWRVKMAISAGLIGLPCPPNSGLAFFFTFLGCMPWRRNCALAMAVLAARISPVLLRPDLSVPFQTKVSFLAALVAILLSVPVPGLARVHCYQS